MYTVLKKGKSINRKYISIEKHQLCMILRYSVKVRLCWHEIHFNLPFAASKHAFVPQYFCSLGIWGGADVVLAFSRTYNVINTIEITSKTNDKTAKAAKHVVLRLPGRTNETPFSCSNGSILKLARYQVKCGAINKTTQRVTGARRWNSRFVIFNRLCLQLTTKLSRRSGSYVTQHNLHMAQACIWREVDDSHSFLWTFSPCLYRYRWKLVFHSTLKSKKEPNTFIRVFRARTKCKFCSIIPDTYTCHRLHKTSEVEAKYIEK